MPTLQRHCMTDKQPACDTVTYRPSPVHLLIRFPPPTAANRFLPSPDQLSVHTFDECLSLYRNAGIFAGTFERSYWRILVCRSNSSITVNASPAELRLSSSPWRCPMYTVNHKLSLQRFQRVVMSESAHRRCKHLFSDITSFVFALELVDYSWILASEG